MAAKKERKTERVVVRLTGQDLEGLRELSEAWHCSVAEAARKAVRAAARVQDMAGMGGETVPPARRRKRKEPGQ